jgi:hypothetical protein
MMQGTGKFTDKIQAEKHIQAGAKKVIITAPARGEGIPTYVMGVNDSDYSHDDHHIIRLKTVLPFLCQSHSLSPFHLYPSFHNNMNTFNK